MSLVNLKLAVETMQTIGVMDWAHCLSEFQAPEMDSAGID